ncbi:TPA: hypothetical protein NJY08_005187 [Salmonella enterica subsp. enterica serovar Typhi str. AG3]|nr:hypothetical protein [Salmonella enterica subsp. enterica serovar Typhi str. AG3]
MELQNIITSTQERLNKFNLGELSHYKSSTQEQFISIERYFLENEKRINNALYEIKSINFNIRGVCKATNISKSTVYKYPNTLRYYIEQRIEDIENQDFLLKNKQERTRERMSELEDFLDKAIIDQIEFNNLKVNNEFLQEEVTRLEKKLDVMSLERIELIRKLNEVELELRRLRNKKGKIISFNQD